MQKGKRRVVTTVLAGVLVIGAVGAMVGATSSGSQQEPQEVDKNIYVATQAPTRGSIVLSSEFVGTVEPNQHVTVYPKFQGEVLAVHYNVGDTVTAGDILLELDSRDMEFTVSQTKASISAAEAKLKLSLDMTAQERENFLNGLETGKNGELIKAEAEVRAAEIEVQAANTSLSSARRLWRDAKNGDSAIYTSDEQIDALRDGVTGAELQLEGAQLKLEAAEEALAAVQKAVADGTVSYDQSVEMAQLNADLSEQYIMLQSLQATLGDAKVKAPISGTIEQRYVDAHDMAAPSVPTYVISNKDVMTIAFSIPEASLPYVKQGDAVTVEKNGETCLGSITEISTMVVAGLYPIKVSVESAPFDLNTGSTVKIYADTQKAIDSILVPIDALHYSGGNAFVYVYDNGFARKVEVKTGIADEENMEVISGLGAGDEIIVTWNSKLSDGAEVLLPGQEPAQAGDADEGTAEDGAGDSAEEDGAGDEPSNE